ncbi:MAG: cysteine desulfurase NifS [Defluviitaleaceae bacterium]|nr:cysteine desulfurase NifS [Defluviitaleaceae bacterium]
MKMCREEVKDMIYLDNAATTRIRPEVLNIMTEFLAENYANPSSIYKPARQAKAAIDKAREQVQKAIGADRPAEVFFTSSGSEAINWALKSIATQNANRGKHIITTAVEHHAVLHTIEYLEKEGFEVTYLPVDEFARIEVEQVKAAIRPDTILVAVMFANNEVGTIMPIAEIGAHLKEINGQRGKDDKVYFFTDAIQAIGRIPVDVNALNIDLMPISAHKLYGPKGVGALYVRRGVKMLPLIHGGGQERGRRGGTENVAGIAALGLAVELAIDEMDETAKKHTEMRQYLIDGILKAIPHSKLNGHPEHRLPNNINITFEFIEGEGMLLLLDSKNIAASSGSACTSGSLDPSHVLMAMGLPHEMAHGSLRLTFGQDTEKGDLDGVLEVLPTIVERLRQISPLWEEFQRVGNIDIFLGK